MNPREVEMVDGDYDVDDTHNNLTTIELATIMPIITIIIMIHILHSASFFCSGRRVVAFSPNRCHKNIPSLNEIIVPYDLFAV